MGFYHKAPHSYVIWIKYSYKDPLKNETDSKYSGTNSSMKTGLLCIPCFSMPKKRGEAR